jgi:hypothetical protein
MVSNDRHDTSFCKRNADESVVRFASLIPGAAIPEDDNWSVSPLAGGDDVQPLSAIRPVRQIEMVLYRREGVRRVRDQELRRTASHERRARQD